MAFSFPSNPSVGDTYTYTYSNTTANGISNTSVAYFWDGNGWQQKQDHKIRYLNIVNDLGFFPFPQDGGFIDGSVTVFKDFSAPLGNGIINCYSITPNTITATTTTSTTLISNAVTSNTVTFGLANVTFGTVVTGGFVVNAYNLGVVSANITLNPLLGNYQYMIANATLSITAPTNDCAIDLKITNGAGSPSLTLGTTQGWQVQSGGTGDAYSSTSGSDFILSVRKIGGIATYVWKALQ